MNRKLLFICILICCVFSFCLATYFYLPFINIPDELHVIKPSNIDPHESYSVNCSKIQKKSWLNKLDVIDASQDNISAYINPELETIQSSDLHIFGVYSGAPIINISKTIKPITLLLASYESTLWSIELENDANIKSIYTFGKIEEIRIKRKIKNDSISKLNNIFFKTPSDLQNINTIIVSKEDSCKTYGYNWKKDHRGKFRYFINVARKITGLTEKSFQGTYSSQENTLPFTIPIELNQENKADLIPKEFHSDNQNRIQPVAYQENINSPEQLIEFVKNAINKGVIPNNIPSPRHNEGKLMEFYPINLEKIKTITTNNNADITYKNSDPAILAGDDRPNIIKSGRGNQIIYAGGGKDLIEDSWGNDILYGGKGDDTIAAHWGSDIIIFNEGWGNDTIDKTCHNSKYRKGRTFGGTEHEYKWKYTNFIIFGPNIKPDDIVRKRNKIINIKTGDSIEIKGNCFNFVYFETE